MLKDIEITNTKFYDAFENLSIKLMDSVWKHSDDCICIHPGWEMFVGWLAIYESWITIFASTENIKFTITNLKIRTYDEVVSVVTCLENIEMSLNGSKIKSGVVATNIYEYDNNQKKWLIIHHHGSPVSNYLVPPKIE